MPRCCVRSWIGDGSSWNVAAHSAARWCVPFRSFYERLVANGKPKKAALTAVARKLLVSVNAMLRDNVDWALQPGCC